MIRGRGWLCCVASAALLVVGFATAGGCGSAPVAAPKEFADYNSPGATFACAYPEGWQSGGGGGRGLEWAKFTTGPAEIRIDAGVAGSLMAGEGGGNTGQFGVTPADLSPELEPVHGVHVMAQKDAEEKFSGYKEVGDVEVLECALGPARRSEFTASSTFGSGLHGYRATALGKDKAVYITCICPESDWKTLQPAFEKVLTSVRRGQVE